MPIPVEKLRSCLLTKFKFEPLHRTKHRACTLIVDGKRVATTQFSRTKKNKDIGPQLLAQIAKDQLFVPKNVLEEMYFCTVSRDDYLEHLRDAGIID